MSTKVTVTRNTPYEDLPEWLSVREFAAYLGLAEWTVYQNIHRGAIPHRRIGLKIIQIPRSFVHSSNAHVADGVQLVSFEPREEAL